MAYIDELLGRGENILYEARQHVVLLISRIFMKLVLIGILIATAIVSHEAFSYNTTAIIAGFTASQIIPALAIFISLLLLISIFTDFLSWNAEQYIITDRRLIQVSGALNKTVLDSPLDKVNNIQLIQSIFGRMFRYGSLHIYTAAEDSVYTMEHVVAPFDFKRAIQEAKQNYERGYGYLDVHTHPQVADTPQNTSPDVHRTIEELATLRDRGILSIDEFEAKKREILSRI